MVTLTGISAQADTQTISLALGTNLIAFQLVPTNPSPAAVFGALGQDFVEASSFDNFTKQWTIYRNPSVGDASLSNGLPGLSMGPVAPGKGYLVRMQAPASLVITGTPLISPSVTVHPGLNLMGFPLPSGAPAAIGLQDLLNGPAYSFPTAFSWENPQYLPFTGNGIADDKVYLFDRNKALWVESTSSTDQTWTPQLTPLPLVYIERGDSIVVEAPLTGAGGSSSVVIPIRLTRAYTGPIGILVSGTAHPNTDFAINAVTPAISPTNSLGSFSISAPANTYQLPVTIREKARLQTNSSVFVTLRRPVETPSVQDSATLPQVAHIKITDGMNGIYEGFLKGTSATATLSGQNFRVALRANGQAIFDPGDGGMISSRFALPYTISGGVPQISGSATVALASGDSLRRTVTVVITPSATVLLNSGAIATPAYEVPLTLTFTNLTASGSFLTTAKLTLTQADPAL